MATTPKLNSFPSITLAATITVLSFSYFSLSQYSPHFVTYLQADQLMQISIGTPPVDILAIADTTSDLTWTNCERCYDCYQTDGRPLQFDPDLSSTYAKITCNSVQCQTLKSAYCSTTQNACQYTSSFLQHPTDIILDLVADTLTLNSATGQNVSFPNLIFGCAHNNDGRSRRKAGVVGLGGGPLSLVSQLGAYIDHKFSYCMSDGLPTKVHFGNNERVLYTEMVTTPLIPQSPDTYYFLSLQGISVGGRRINVRNHTLSSDAPTGYSEGNMIIDSTTRLTTLPSYLYYQVETEVRGFVKLDVATPSPEDLSPDIPSLCYSMEEANKGDYFPDITLHFKDNADVKLTDRSSTFIGDTVTIGGAWHRHSEQVYCLAFLSTDEDFGVLGYLAQQGFLIAYNLEERTVSFGPTACHNQ